MYKQDGVRIQVNLAGCSREKGEWKWGAGGRGGRMLFLPTLAGEKWWVQCLSCDEGKYAANPDLGMCSTPASAFLALPSSPYWHGEWEWGGVQTRPLSPGMAWFSYLMCTLYTPRTNIYPEERPQINVDPVSVMWPPTRASSGLQVFSFLFTCLFAA